MNTNDNSSKTSHWLNKATKILESSDIPTARLDCLVLLEDFTGKDRSWLLAYPEYDLGDTALLDEQLKRRARHEPLAYIRRKSEFYGRTFAVNEHTLEPRPETETMVELALDIIDKKCLIIDVGTGSGCIAITMKLELPEAAVIAIDLDEKCIETATHNADNLKSDVQFYTGNLLEPLSSIKYQTSDIILLANLPYVPDAYKLNEAAMFEPRHAIFGGKDGLDLYRQLFTQVSNLSWRPKYVITESLPTQHEGLSLVASKAGFKLQKSEDFIQVFNSQ